MATRKKIEVKIEVKELEGPYSWKTVAAADLEGDVQLVSPGVLAMAVLRIARRLVANVVDEELTGKSVLSAEPEAIAADDFEPEAIAADDFEPQAAPELDAADVEAVPV
jgi:hypothetical protein